MIEIFETALVNEYLPYLVPNCVLYRFGTKDSSLSYSDESEQFRKYPTAIASRGNINVSTFPQWHSDSLIDTWFYQATIKYNVSIYVEKQSEAIAVATKVRGNWRKCPYVAIKFQNTDIPIGLRLQNVTIGEERDNYNKIGAKRIVGFDFECTLALADYDKELNHVKLIEKVNISVSDASGEEPKKVRKTIDDNGIRPIITLTSISDITFSSAIVNLFIADGDEVSKTGVQVDNDQTFSNPITYEQDGVVDSILINNLGEGTQYYVRGYVVCDERIIESGDILECKTKTIDYFCITNVSDESNSIIIEITGNPIDGTDIEYSLNKIDFQQITYSSNKFNIDIPKGGQLYLRSTNGFSSDNTNFRTISSSNSIYISGDICTLIDYTNNEVDTIPNGCFVYLFRENDKLIECTLNFNKITTINSEGCSGMFLGCTSLIIAPELPATNLSSNCYNGMFRNCTSLTIAPELPAVNLANFCYRFMFAGCTSLIKAPELPAQKPLYYSYGQMFSGCTSLNYVKCLATDISSSNCTNGWLGNVSESGIFVKPSNMTSWETGNSGIPSGWTIQNI